jgi:hypothetical protein
MHAMWSINVLRKGGGHRASYRNAVVTACATGRLTLLSSALLTPATSGFSLIHASNLDKVLSDTPPMPLIPRKSFAWRDAMPAKLRGASHLSRA